MGALPELITVAKYWQIAEAGSRYCELHSGEVVPKPFRKNWQTLLEHRLRDLLGPRVKGFEVALYFTCRPEPEFEVRAADVMALSRKRWDTMDPEDYLHGAPDLVVKVIASCATTEELRKYAVLSLNGGAKEFWAVNQENRSVTVVRTDGISTLYGPGSEIPLSAFDGDSLRVDDIFA